MGKDQTEVSPHDLHHQLKVPTYFPTIYTPTSLTLQGPLGIDPSLQSSPQLRQSISDAPLHASFLLNQRLPRHPDLYSRRRHHHRPVHGLQRVLLLHARPRLLESQHPRRLLSSRGRDLAAQRGHPDLHRRLVGDSAHAGALPATSAPTTEMRSHLCLRPRRLVHPLYSLTVVKTRTDETSVCATSIVRLVMLINLIDSPNLTSSSFPCPSVSVITNLRQRKTHQQQPGPSSRPMSPSSAPVCPRSVPSSRMFSRVSSPPAHGALIPLARRPPSTASTSRPRSLSRTPPPV